MRTSPTRGVSPSSDELARLNASIATGSHARRFVPMSEKEIRVMLVDDHAIVREGLRLVLRNARDISVIAEAPDGITALALAQRSAPDIVVLDLDMPRGDGEATLAALKRALPNVRVLILTVHAEQERLLALLAAGAHGYLTKEAASRDLVDAIRVVAAGEVYVRPATARLLAAAFVPHQPATSALQRFGSLSEREQNVLRMVAQGYSGAEIARHFRISSKTVDAYKHRIRDKLALEHRTDYVRFAIEAGILRAARQFMAQKS